jgi:DNA-binding response OmpR family regulator
MNRSILLVDDEPSLQHTVKQILEKEGYKVRAAGSAEDALVELRKSVPDLVLLDVRLPGQSGFDLCKKIRDTPEWRALPVIFLTSRDDEAGVVLGLELGGDDYVIKPFGAAALVARVKAVLRRKSPEKEGEEVLTGGTLEVRVSRHEVLVDGKPLKLLPKEFDLLCCLLRKKGRALTRHYLLERVWGRDDDGPLSRTVDTHVYRLRKTLGSLSNSLQSVGTVGYKWVDPE